MFRVLYSLGHTHEARALFLRSSTCSCKRQTTTKTGKLLEYLLNSDQTFVTQFRDKFNLARDFLKIQWHLK